MNTPIFQLEHVVKIKEEDALENFVGPLDLILYLLSKNKIAIQDIKIADLLDQYLAYIEQCQTMDLEVASEFVAMAAHLVYIKTRMLLSIEDEEAKSEMDQLIRSLEERQRNEDYMRVKAMAEKLEVRGNMGGIFLPNARKPWTGAEFLNTIRKNPIWSCACRIFWIALAGQRCLRCILSMGL